MKPRVNAFAILMVFYIFFLRGIKYKYSRTNSNSNFIKKICDKSWIFEDKENVVSIWLIEPDLDVKVVERVHADCGTISYQKFNPPWNKM